MLLSTRSHNSFAYAVKVCHFYSPTIYPGKKASSIFLKLRSILVYIRNSLIQSAPIRRPHTPKRRSSYWDISILKTSLLYITTEILPLFPNTKGLMMVGSLPVAIYNAPVNDERTKWNRRQDLTADDLIIFTKIGTGGPFEQWMADTVIRTDPKARRMLFENVSFGDCSNQRQLVARLNTPTAVVIGTDEPHLDNNMIKGLPYGRFWSGKVIEITGGQHCPVWEKPEDFLPVLDKILGVVATS